VCEEGRARSGHLLAAHSCCAVADTASSGSGRLEIRGLGQLSSQPAGAQGQGQGQGLQGEGVDALGSRRRVPFLFLFD